MPAVMVDTSCSARRSRAAPAFSIAWVGSRAPHSEKVMPGCATVHAMTTWATDAEQALYRELREDRLGERLRLEQEHVRFGWLRQALEKL